MRSSRRGEWCEESMRGLFASELQIPRRMLVASSLGMTTRVFLAASAWRTCALDPHFIPNTSYSEANNKVQGSVHGSGDQCENNVCGASQIHSCKRRDDEGWAHNDIRVFKPSAQGGFGIVLRQFCCLFDGGKMKKIEAIVQHPETEVK